MDQSTFNTNKYPTLADYFNAENPEGIAIIEETQENSTFLTDAAMVPTNDGTRYKYRRKGEMKFNPRPASFDEGYRAEKQTFAGKDLTFDTMRVTDSIEWERKHKANSETNGSALKDEQMKKLTDAMIQKKVNFLLYGDKNKKTDYGLEIDGLMQFVNGTIPVEEYYNMMSKLSSYGNIENPFDTHGILNLDLGSGEKDYELDSETLLCFDNQRDPDSGELVGLSSGNRFASILGIAWGTEGVLSFFPEVIDGAGAGFYTQYTEGFQKTYTDPRDGLEKRYVADAYDMDEYFGVGVLNRFCLSRLSNINLFNTTKDAKKAEMERVERYCIMMQDFFNKAKTGMKMKFYCPEELVRQMELYQKEMYPANWYATNSRQFDGKSPLVRPKEIAITSDITLVSDSIFRTSEAHVGSALQEV